MKEFEEIAHSGGKIEFKKGEKGGVSLKFSQSNPWTVAMYQICVSLDGKLIDVVSVGGIGQQIVYPQPSILVWIISDRQGFFGRVCPNCKSYFRTTYCGMDIFCPYCGFPNHNLNYTTPNQLEFITAFCNAFLEAYNGNEDIVIDLDNIAGNLSNNKPQWVYSEEKQQNTYKCEKCRVKYDILGEYGGCPCCNNRNYLEVIAKKLENFDKRFLEEDEKLSDRHDREVQWENLTRCVSEFEAMANDLKNQLLTMPATPKRKSDIENLSFQNILKANDCIKNWFGYEILEGLPENDRKFLNIMFNRRHVFTHNAGKVDQEYLDNTGDTKVRLNQVIRLRSREIKRLIPLINQISKNLILGFESIN